MGVRARFETVVGDERLRSKGHGGGRKRAFGPDPRRWRRKTSDCTRIDELRWWKWEMSDCARIGIVEADDECSGSNQHIGGGR